VNYGLQYTNTDDVDNDLFLHCDVDYAGSKTQKSITGYVTIAASATVT